MTQELDDAVRRVLAMHGKRPRPEGWVRDTLAVVLIMAFIATLPLLVWKTIPDGNKETVVYILGQISGMATTVLGFYFVSKAGADKLDEKRAENTNAAFRAIEASAQAMPAEHKPDHILKPGESAQAEDRP